MVEGEEGKNGEWRATATGADSLSPGEKLDLPSRGEKPDLPEQSVPNHILRKFHSQSVALTAPNENTPEGSSVHARERAGVARFDTSAKKRRSGVGRQKVNISGGTKRQSGAPRSLIRVAITFSAGALPGRGTSIPTSPTSRQASSDSQMGNCIMQYLMWSARRISSHMNR